jgi:murein L,D-transpeptidase YcbB/YkuD
LGRVKFVIPNQFNVCLHDTPVKSLFSRSRRCFSHGCVRLEKAFALAYLLLKVSPVLVDRTG